METYDELGSMTPKEIGELEEKRIAALQEANINESEVLDNAKKNITNYTSYFNENITRGKADMDFLLKDQWTAADRSEFSRTFKPALVFNKLYDPTKKIAGEQRKNKPDLMVRSLTGKASQDQIDLRSDMIRTIAYQSQNDLVIQAASMSALYLGFGAFDIEIDYESPRSFRQILRLGLISNPIMTAFDPTAIKPHKGDGNFCSRQFLMSKQEFNATYPNATNAVSYADPNTLLDFQWETKDSIIICKYTQKEWYPITICQLSNGMVVTKDEWEDMQKQFSLKKELAKESIIVGGMILDEIPELISERQSQDYKINQYILTRDQILDFTVWPSKHLPCIFVDGDSVFIEGKQYTQSFIHKAKDAQKFINYVGSEIAAEIKNRRREQWMGTQDNIAGQEQMWRNPESQTGILIAKPDPKTGSMPIKLPPWDLSPSLMANFQRGSQDIREILGFSEAEELQGRDVSGKARRERKLEGSMSAYVYFDNRNQALEQAGRVMLDLLPIVYSDKDRPFVLSKQDGKTQNVILNKTLKDGTVENSLEGGEYDIEIDTGPSFAVQKDIALEFFQQTLAENPQVFPLIADLWAKNLDIQCMPQIVERLKTLVPPQILAKEEGKELPPQPPSPQEQMQQMQMKMAVQELQDKEKRIKLEEEELNIKKKELMLKVQEMMEKSKSNKLSKEAEMHKTELNYAADVLKTLTSLHQ